MAGITAYEWITAVVRLTILPCPAFVPRISVIFATTMSTQPVPAAEVAGQTEASPPESPANPVIFIWATFATVLAILVFIGVTMYLATTAQIAALKDGFAHALNPPNHTAAVSYSNAMTAAVTKTSSVFLSFLVVFLGGIYVLMPKRDSFALDVQSHSVKANLASNSPGLVMMTLGIALTIVALAMKSEITIEGNGSQTEPASPQETMLQQTPSSDFAPPPIEAGQQP